MREDDVSEKPFPSRTTDVGVISAFRLAAVLLGVLVPLATAFGWYVTIQIERAVLLNNALVAERYVTKADQEASSSRLQKRLDEIQAQLEKNRLLTERVAIRLKVEP